MKFVPACTCLLLFAPMLTATEESPRTSAYTVGVSYGESARRVVEYDDRWRDAPTPYGIAAVRHAVASFSREVTPTLALAARAGAASLEMKGFEGPHAISYDQAYGFGPTLGVGLLSDIGTVPRVESTLTAFFDFNWTRPATWYSTVHGAAAPYRALLTDWQFGIRTEREWRRWGCFAGTRWSDASILYEHESQAFAGKRREGGYEPVQHAGVFGGISRRVGEACRITLQGSGIDINGGEVQFSYGF